MPLFIFFVNRPLTIIPYVLGIFLLIGVNTLDLDFFPLPSIGLIMVFSHWYSLFLIRHYVLRNHDDKILGIEVRKFRALVSFALWTLGLGIVLACIFIGYLKQSIFSAILVLAFNAIGLSILESTVKAKLLSEGVRKKTSLKDFDIDKIYTEIRELILTKVIEP